MASWNDVLTCIAEFLIEFLAGPQPGKLNTDLLVRFEPCKLDELSSQIHNFHRLAHIESKDFSPCALGCALQNQADCLGDSHEIPGHFRMCHCHRTTGGDLLVK